MGSDYAGDFTYQHYARIIAAARDFAEMRLIRDCRQLDLSAGDFFFLRHDIDCTLDAALRMGEFEASIGARSTYYVMMKSTLYDPISPVLRQLDAMGHEVGVHFDCPDELRSNEGDVRKVESLIVQDCRRLEDFLGRSVDSLSFHRPVEYLLRGPMIVAERVNAYAAELMAWYISDSRGSWRVGPPVPEVEARRHRTLQILTHPIWWSQAHLAAPDRLQEFFVAFTRGLSAIEADDFDKKLTATMPGVRRRG